MKRVLWVILILTATAAWAEKAKPNPADYTVDLHVQSSRMEELCEGTCNWFQFLGITVDGKRYELRSDVVPKAYILKLGDYKAKIVKEDDTKSYGYQRTYQILFPDGSVAEYLVVGESE